MLKKSSALLALIFLLTSAFSFCAFAEPEETAAEETTVADTATEDAAAEDAKAQDTVTDDAAQENADESSEAPVVKEDKETEEKAEEKAEEKEDAADSAETTGVITGKVSIQGGGIKLFSDILGFFTKYLGYIAGILVFALIVKIILFPLSIKQQKNSQKMAKLAPKQEAIRKKYAGRTDRATQMKMNEEIQRLYAEEKFNPMGGCLPMLLQLPIILLLYTTINSPLSSMSKTHENYVDTNEISAIITENAAEYGLEVSEKGGALTQAKALSLIANAKYDFDEIEDEEIDPVTVTEEQKVSVLKLREYYKSFKVGPINLMENPSWTPIFNALIPFLVFLSSFFSTKLIRKFTYNPNGAAGDASMKFMDWTMPLMILWFSFNVPALIGVYWIFQNVISIGQQYLLSKLFPVKAPTPEEIREAELLMRGKKSKRDDDDREERRQTNNAIKKAPIKKKKSNSPFIYAKKGIDEKYLEKVKAKGVVPKAKMKP